MSAAAPMATAAKDATVDVWVSEIGCEGLCLGEPSGEARTRATGWRRRPQLKARMRLGTVAWSLTDVPGASGVCFQRSFCGTSRLDLEWACEQLPYNAVMLGRGFSATEGVRDS
jgi:hypothetical protein